MFSFYHIILPPSPMQGLKMLFPKREWIEHLGLEKVAELVFSQI